MSRCDFESKLWSNPTEKKKKKRIAFTITSWSPWQPWLSLHERLTECDLQWSFLWSRSWRLGIPANTMAGFSINMIICCRLPGRWTSTASGERLELYMRQQRGWMTTEYRRCTWPQMYTHHHIGEWRYLILIQKKWCWQCACSSLNFVCSPLHSTKCQGPVASFSDHIRRGFKMWFIYIEIWMPKWSRP